MVTTAAHAAIHQKGGDSSERALDEMALRSLRAWRC